MKILHIINNLAVGGAQKIIEELVPLQNQYRYVQVDVLLLSDKNIIFDEKLKQYNIKIDVVPFRDIYGFRNINYIRKYIIQGVYDIVHTHLFPCNYWVSIASKLMFLNKPKFITTEHSTHNKRRDKFYLRIIERFIYSSYDIIISISEGTQRNLVKWIKPKNKDKFVVIENGINLENFMNAEPYKKYDLDSQFSESTKLLCMVGSFSKQKDQATIIQAMKNLPEDTFLLLVGDGSLRSANERLAKQLEVDDRVKFLGIRKDIPKMFKTSDIVIVSSQWEGFGLAAVEGMAAGKPVIASDVQGLAEVVRGAGFLFKKENVKELSNIINNLLGNKTEYNEACKRSLKRSNRYNIHRTVDDYIKVYSKIL